MEKKKEMKHLVMKMNEMNISNEDVKDEKKDKMMEFKKEKEKKTEVKYFVIKMNEMNSSKEDGKDGKKDEIMKLEEEIQKMLKEYERKIETLKEEQKRVNQRVKKLEQDNQLKSSDKVT